MCVDFKILPEKELAVFVSHDTGYKAAGIKGDLFTDI